MGDLNKTASLLPSLYIVSKSTAFRKQMDEMEGGRFGRSGSRALTSGHRWLKSSSEGDIKTLVTGPSRHFSSSEFQSIWQKKPSESSKIVTGRCLLSVVF